MYCKMVAKSGAFSPGPISRSNPPFEAADLRGSFADGQTPPPLEIQTAPDC